MTDSGRRALAEAVGRACGGRVCICYSEEGSSWRSTLWGDESVRSTLDGWRPSAVPLDHPMMRSAQGQSVCPTEPLLPLASAPAQALERLKVELRGGALLAPRLSTVAPVMFWLGLPSEASKEQLQDVVRLAETLTGELQGRYYRFCQQTPAVFVAIDRHGLICDCNEEVRSQLGYTPEELIGQPSTLILAPGERERLRQRIIAGARVPRLESTARTRSGEYVPVDVMATMITDQDGNPEEIVAIGRDLREDRRVDHYRRLEAVGRLVSGVAHELNNPLLTVLGNAEMLAEMKLPASAHRRAERVLAGARRCQEVVDGLLRLRVRRRELTQEVSLEQVVDRALRSVTAEFDALKITTEVSYPSESFLLRGDAADLEQAFSHVLRNALQALERSPEPRLSVRVELIPGAKVRVTIQDNGPGMSEEVLLRAFEPFFTTREIGAGKGLGLSIAMGVVQDHGGYIELYSDSRGTRVLVVLPLGETTS